jgi:hypothetical protein
MNEARAFVDGFDAFRRREVSFVINQNRIRAVGDRDSAIGFGGF